MYFTDETESKRTGLVLELSESLESSGCQIIGANGISGCPMPPFLHNDGYGDQKSKMPDILAYDQKTKEFIVGIARVSRAELESERALTEYDVFFDQKDNNGKPYRVVIIAPPELASEVASVVTHYIHRELWHLLTIVAGKSKMQDL
ncbi:MAG: hypothetical protein EPO24_16340 [Bacteroidetes bacterium]|nr:MAG: hypothetical protein EPO24_16340 [Bacteroidota bacterium]